MEVDLPQTPGRSGHCPRGEVTGLGGSVGLSTTQGCPCAEAGEHAHVDRVLDFASAVLPGALSPRASPQGGIGDLEDFLYLGC